MNHSKNTVDIETEVAKFLERDFNGRFAQMRRYQSLIWASANSPSLHTPPFLAFHHGFISIHTIDTYRAVLSIE